MKIKTHLITTDIQDEFETKWIGRLKDMNPVMKNGAPQFFILSSCGRLEVPTFNINAVEKAARKFTYCKGKQSLTKDKAYIYLITDKGDELVGITTHYRIKHFSPMYDDPQKLKGTQWEYLVDAALRRGEKFIP